MRVNLRVHCGAVFLVVSSTLAAGVARAEPSRAVTAQNVALADALFQEATQAVADGRYAEACPKFAESDRLDPGMRARYLLADCYEKIGSLASAWKTFLSVADWAAEEGQKEREARARERASALKPRLPMLTVVMPEVTGNHGGIEVRDGGLVLERPTWGIPMPVNPGEHTISITIHGRAPWSKTLVLKEAAEATLVVVDSSPQAAPFVGPPVAKPSLMEPLAPPMEPPALRSSKVGSIVAGTAGLLGVVLGVGYGADASEKWDEVKTLCHGRSDFQQCDPGAKRRELDARASANVSTATFVIGGVALTSAAILLFLPSRSASARTAQQRGLWMAPAVGPGEAGVVVKGAF